MISKIHLNTYLVLKKILCLRIFNSNKREKSLFCSRIIDTKVLTTIFKDLNKTLPLKNIHRLLIVMLKRKLPKWTCDFAGQILHHEKRLRRIRTRHFEGTFLLQQIHSDSGCCFGWRSLNEIIILTIIFQS